MIEKPDLKEPTGYVGNSSAKLLEFGWKIMGIFG
jgi:hypothetical protein